MAIVIIKLKVMPAAVETDLKAVEEACKGRIEAFGGKFYKSEIKPIAFGLNALEIIFTMEESIGSTEPLEHSITEIEDVQSVDVIDVRRAFG